jgi:DNA-directed RNA polymerase subunit L
MSCGLSTFVLQIVLQLVELNSVLIVIILCSPHIIIAQYAQKHPVNREEITLHCQTDSHISAKQGLAEAVETTRSILSHVSDAMTKAVDSFQQN